MDQTSFSFNDKGKCKGGLSSSAWVELNLRGFKSLERKIPKIMVGICLGDWVYSFIRKLKMDLAVARYEIAKNSFFIENIKIIISGKNGDNGTELIINEGNG